MPTRNKNHLRTPAFQHFNIGHLTEPGNHPGKDEVNVAADDESDLRSSDDERVTCVQGVASSQNLHLFRQSVVDDPMRVQVDPFKK